MESMIQRFLADAPHKGVALLEDSLRRVRNRKSTYLLLAVMLLPVLLAPIFKSSLEDYESERDVADRAAEIFITIFSWIYLRVLVLVAVLLIGAGLIQEEREDRTLQLLLTSPLTRFEVVFYKYFAAVPLITAITWVPVVVFYLAIMGIAGWGALGTHLGLLGVALLLTFLSVAAYTAAIFAITAATRYPMIVGAVFVFLWEQLVGLAPFWAQKLTISHYIRSATLPLLSEFIGEYSAIATLGLRDESSWYRQSLATGWAESLLVLAVVSLLFFTLAVRLLRTRDAA